MLVLGGRGAINPVLAQGRGASGNGLLTNLIAYWKLDEASGNATDAHSNGLTLTANNAPGATTGKISGARTFNGTSQSFSRVDTASLEIGTGSLSFSVWVNRTSNAGVSNRIIAHGAYDNSTQGYSLFGSNTYCRFIVGNGTTRLFCETPSFGTGAWWHIVAVVNRTAGTIVLYANGTAGTATDISSFSANNIDFNSVWQLGSDVNIPSYFPGSIDECGVWNRALSATDVAALYNSGNGLVYSSFTA